MEKLRQVLLGIETKLALVWVHRAFPLVSPNWTNRLFCLIMRFVKKAKTTSRSRRQLALAQTKTQDVLSKRSHRAETIKFLTLDELKRLFQQIKDKRDKVIFLLAYRHGLRASEVEMLQKNDYQSEHFSSRSRFHFQRRS